MRQRPGPVTQLLLLSSRVQALLIYGLFPGEVLEGDLPPSLFGVRRMVPFRIDRVYIIPLGFLPFVS